MSPHRRLFIRNSMINLDIKRDLLPLKTPLFRLALRILLDRPEAEDIVQDVLVKIWEMRDTQAFLEIKNLETYALTMVRNLALDRQAQRQGRHITLENAGLLDDNNGEKAPEHEIAGNNEQPDEQMERNERLQWLREMLNMLPEKQRTVLQLRDIEEHSYQEIGEIMKIGESDVKVTLHRARQTLMKIILERHANGL